MGWWRCWNWRATSRRHRPARSLAAALAACAATPSPSLRRLFYLPVEDLLEAGEFPVEADRIGRVATALAWNFLIGDANPEWSAIQADFQAAAASRDKLEELGKRLWPHAGARLGQALDGDGDRDARRRLVGVRTEFVPEFERLALLLRLGGEVQAIKSQLPPKPIRTLAPDHLLAIRDFLQHHCSGEIDRAFALLLAIGARMAVPAELIRHVALMPLGLLKSDHLVVIERLQGTALADIDRAARRAEEAPTDDTVGRANLAKELVQAISAAQDGFAMGGRMSKELTRLRGTAEKAVTSVVTDAGAKVTSTVEIGPSAPLEAHVDAENNLLALRKCQSFAPAVGMEGKVNETLNSIASAVRDRAAGLFKGHRRRKCRGQRAWHARRAGLLGRTHAGAVGQCR